MTLQNYRDLSDYSNDMEAGFQFEFFCTNCDRTWQTEFKPYRLGQAARIFSQLLYFVRGAGSDVSDQARFASMGASDVGMRGARDKWLAKSMEQAETLYAECAQCRKAVCADCYNTSQGICVTCEARARGEIPAGQADGAVASCPNCQTPSSGGRFCAECGFDMASTHKSCPSCSAMMPRQARFCTDCGHSF